MMPQIDPESPEWAIAHVRSYLHGTTDLEKFWEPIPQITTFYEDYPNEPTNRLAYFWQEVAKEAMAVARLGHIEGEPDFRTYLARWLDALQLSDAEWKQIVKEKRGPLEETIPD
jgi:hypothetical protein